MKKRHLVLPVAVMLAVGGWWFARFWVRTETVPAPSRFTGLGTPPGDESAIGVGTQAPPGPPQPGARLRPPDPARRFMDFTPEQRVEFARRGHGPGG